MGQQQIQNKQSWIVVAHEDLSIKSKYREKLNFNTQSLTGSKFMIGCWRVWEVLRYFLSLTSFDLYLAFTLLAGCDYLLTSPGSDPVGDSYLPRHSNLSDVAGIRSSRGRRECHWPCRLPHRQQGVQLQHVLLVPRVQSRQRRIAWVLLPVPAPHKFVDGW